MSGAVANANYALNAGNANFANSATIANSANSVTLANVSGAGNIASINLDGSSSNVLFGNGTFGPEGSTGNANYANFAGNAFAVDGANVSGTVANATYAANAGNANFANSATTANTANIANIAYSVDGANVSGTVANATYAANAGAAFTANSANTATVANSANSVTLANVSGAGNIASINLDGNVSNLLTGNGTFVAIPTVSANANYANFAGNAFAVDGANVNGAVANATFALDAGNANIANIAYSVDVSNVANIGNIATINLDGNASNLLDGTGNFVAIPTVSANANYANFAGTVLTNAQPNITSLGTLTNATVSDTGNIILGNMTINEFSQAGRLTMQANSNSFPGLVLSGSNISNITGFVDTFISGGSIETYSGTLGSNASRLTTTTANLTAGGFFLRPGNTFAGNNPGRSVSGGSFSVISSTARALEANIVSGGVIGLTAGGAAVISANTVTSGGAALNSGSISIEGNAASFSIGNANLSAATLQMGQFTLNRSNGVVGNIRFPLTQFGAAAFGVGIGFSNGVSNISVANVLVTDHMYFRTPNVGHTSGQNGGNVNNVAIGNITTQDIRMSTGYFTYANGANVSNVTAGNLTTGRVEIITGTATNVASVTGTLTRGNIRLNASSIVLQADANVATSGTGEFVFNANNTATLGNLVVSNYFSGNGSLLTGINSANANYANFAGNAFAVDGANVSGTVANATFALDAGNANFANSATTANTANSANSVTLANVSGAGNIASINLDGSSSNVLYGNGVFAASSGGNGVPGGANTELQFNANGAFGGISTVTWNGSNLSLGNISNVKVNGGANTDVIRTDGTGNLSFASIAETLLVGTRAGPYTVPITNYTFQVTARTGNVTVYVN